MIPSDRALLCGGALDLWSECCQISAGVGRTVVVYHGVLLGPRQCLDNRGHRRDHQTAAPGGGALLVVGNFNTYLNAPEGQV